MRIGSAVKPASLSSSPRDDEPRRHHGRRPRARRRPRPRSRPAGAGRTRKTCSGPRGCCRHADAAGARGIPVRRRRARAPRRVSPRYDARAAKQAGVLAGELRARSRAASTGCAAVGAAREDEVSRSHRRPRRSSPPTRARVTFPGTVARAGAETEIPRGETLLLHRHAPGAQAAACVRQRDRARPGLPAAEVARTTRLVGVAKSSGWSARGSQIIPPPTRVGGAGRPFAATELPVVTSADLIWLTLQRRVPLAQERRSARHVRRGHARAVELTPRAVAGGHGGEDRRPPGR